MKIIGLGVALPAASVDQQEAAVLAAPLCCATQKHARVLPLLYRRSRVQRRGSVLLEESDALPFYSEQSDAGPTTHDRMLRYEREALPLALDAAKAALSDAGAASTDITDLVTVSCTGFAAPGIDIELIKHLGLAAGTSRTHVGFMGCHGAFNGLRVARGLAGEDGCVLMVCVELCSLHLSYGWDPQRIVANALFADGAGAVVGQRVDRAAAPAPGVWSVVAGGSQLLPDSEDLMTWRIGDHGFEMTLSPRVPEVITQHLRPWLEHWLLQHDLTIEGVGSWAIHPGGPRVVSAVAESLGLTRDAVADSLAVLAEHGNMSSSTILFILSRLRSRDAARPCVAVGFGPGLTVEAMLLR